MTWTAKSLDKDYKRSFIGYDLRIRDEGNSPKTLSPEVWERHACLQDITFDHEINGLNLLVSCEDVIKFAEVAKLVAFDIPSQLADSISHTFGLRPLEQIDTPVQGNWKFLGFDIVDPRTQSSALHDFPGCDASIDSVAKNKSGLIDDISQSIILSIESDRVFKEHAPFVPCGVWVFRAKRGGRRN